MATPVRKRPEASPPRARTRVVVSARPGDPEPAADPNRHGDRTALGRMATGPDLAPPEHFPSAAEIDPAPADPGRCPTCGQPRSNAVNEHATGRFGSVPLPAREADAALDPDGELAYAVLDHLRERVPVAEIARTVDVTPGQVLGVALAHGIPTEEAA